MGSDALPSGGVQPPALEGLFTHEFGHILGLRDIKGSYCTSHSGAHSVMNSCTAAPSLADGGVFPLSWDKDCVADAAPSRMSYHVWQGYDSVGGRKGSHVVDSTPTQKPALGSGALRTTTNQPMYLLHHTDRVRSGGLGYDGIIGLANYFWDSYEEPHLSPQDVRMFPFAPEEFAASNDAVHFAFMDDEQDSYPAAKYNPPYAQYIIDDAILSYSTPRADHDLKRCLSSSCSSWSYVRSHLPLGITWDPVSENTIVASVLTASSRDTDPGGQMWLNVGFHAPGYLKYEPLGLLTSTELNLPSETSPFDWTGRTWNQPAVACGDSDYAGAFGFNCILAWTDRGLVDPAGQDVLYKWFRVGTDGYIEFDATTHVRTGANTTSAPSLGFFGGMMWFAWRATQTFSRVEIARQAAAGGSWSTQPSISSIEGVEAPSFLYRDGRESALFWTISK